MAKRVSDMELQLARDRGAKVTRPAMEIDFPGLATIIEYFKHEMAEEKNDGKDDKDDKAHAEHRAKKFQMMQQLIDAVKAVKMPAAPRQKDIDLKPLIEAVMARREDDDDGEACDYKLTFKRDQRGLIDGDQGILFTAIDKD